MVSLLLGRIMGRFWRWGFLLGGFSLGPSRSRASRGATSLGALPTRLLTLATTSSATTSTTSSEKGWGSGVGGRGVLITASATRHRQHIAPKKFSPPPAHPPGYTPSLEAFFIPDQALNHVRSERNQKARILVVAPTRPSCPCSQSLPFLEHKTKASRVFQLGRVRGNGGRRCLGSLQPCHHPIAPGADRVSRARRFKEDGEGGPAEEADVRGAVCTVLGCRRSLSCGCR